MSADDLVVRLQATLDEIEKRARLAQPGPWHIGNAVDPTKPCNVHTFPAVRGVADEVPWLDAEHIVLHAPDRVLPLVQALRDILDMYREAKAQPARRDKGKLRGLDHASAMGRLTTLGLVIQKLAEGYGVLEQT